MSYRELRNMGNLLRKIGYTRLVSFESFRTPNFKLVEDIVRWFVTQLEPGNDFLFETDTEQQRVIFIRAFVELMLKKVNIKLNPKRLYQADGYAVRELLKVTEFINKVINNSKDPRNRSNGNDMTRFYQFQPSLTRVRKVQELASKMTKTGVSLFDLLSKEVYLRANRTAALNRHYDLKEFEQTIQKAIGVGRTEQAKLEASIETAESNITIINTKIEKKKQELERNEQRLQTMNKVRPAYMDEYEKIQKELEEAYLTYVTRFKITCHLQHQMEEISRVDEARRAEEKLIKQDLENSDDFLVAGMRRLSDSDDEESIIEDSVQQNARDFMISRAGAISKLQRPQGTARNEMSLGGMSGRPNTRVENEHIDENDDLLVGPGPSKPAGAGGRTTARKPRHVVGSMFGLEDDDDEEDEETESGSEMILLGGQTAEDNSDLGSEIDDEEHVLTRPLGVSKVSVPSNLKHHILREEMKSNPAEAMNMLNGESAMALLNKPMPPGPNVSNAGSVDDLKGHLRKQQEMEERHLQKKAKRSSSRTNGEVRTNRTVDDDPFSGVNETLTRPLQPDPRLIPAAVASTSQGMSNGTSVGSMGVMGNGRGPIPPKSSGKTNKYSARGRTGTQQKDDLGSARPRTRPGSQTQQITSGDLLSDDDF